MVVADEEPEGQGVPQPEGDEIPGVPIDSGGNGTDASQPDAAQASGVGPEVKEPGDPLSCAQSDETLLDSSLLGGDGGGPGHSGASDAGHDLAAGDAPFLVIPNPGVAAQFVAGLALAGGVAIGVFAARLWGRRKAAGAAAPATPKETPRRLPSTMASLVSWLRDHPEDGEARLRLGVLLFKRRREDDALAQLEQAFWQEPGLILHILEDPKLGMVREHPRVQVLLHRYLRNMQMVHNSYV